MRTVEYFVHQSLARDINQFAPAVARERSDCRRAHGPSGYSHRFNVSLCGLSIFLEHELHEFNELGTMAAKDYKICPAMFNAYIAKVSKRNPNQMTDDRRPIEEGEIMMLIDWYLDNELGEKYKTISFDYAREGKKVVLKYIDKEDEKDKEG